jgi:PAS domain S-box-containing protein
MKRSTTGRFLTNWDGESKKRVNLSLTETAWNALDEFAEASNLSKSEVIERYARSLKPDNCPVVPFVDRATLPSRALNGHTQIKAELRQANDRFELAAAAVKGMIYDWDVERNYVERTQGLIEITGYSPEEAEPTAEWWNEQVHPDDRLQLQKLATTLSDSDHVSRFTIEYRVCHRDGHYRSVWDRGLIDRNAQGQAIRIVGFSLDITERKQVEASVQHLSGQVQEQAKTLKAILSVSTDHIYVFDRVGRYRYVSDGGAQVLGFQPHEMMGKDWRELGLPAEVMQPVDAQREEVVASGQPLKREVAFTTPEGTRYYEYVLTPLQDSKHSIEGVVVISRDITERRQAENGLQRYRLVSEHSRDIMLYLSSEGHILEANQAAINAYGYDRAELLSFKITNLRTAQTRAALAQQLAQATEQGILFETMHRRKDGSDFPVEVSAQSTEIGNETVILSIVRDITERKEAEVEREQLLVRERHARIEAEKAQQQLSTIFETSPIGIGFLDHEQRYVAINKALAEINGLSREQHLGRTVSELFGASDPGLVDLVQRMYTTGEPFISPELAATVPGRHDRCPGYYYVHYLPTKDQSGSVQGVLVYVVDVTERVRLEQAQHYLSEASTVLASSLDYQTTLERVAQLTVPKLADWCTVHIVEEDASLQQLAVAHIDPEKIEWAHQLQQKYPLNPDSPRGAALTLRTGQSDLLPDIPDEMLIQAARDPEHLQILREVGFKSVMAVPLRSQEQILGAISFISAESGRRYTATDLAVAEELARRASLAIDNARLYRAAQRARAQAEAANRVKDEFLAVLSHELRTPLNPILGWAKMLRGNRKLDEHRTALALDTIERNANLQAQLIEDLLDISRILQGKLRLTMSSLNLAPIIEAAIGTVQLSAEAKAIQLHWDSAPTVGQVLGDPNRLQQIIWNLLSNAIKFTPQGGQVEIRLAQVGTRAQITVIDRGKGISADFLPYVFDAFRQADGTTTRTFGGLGLGLSIARHLVELHGGTITAHSAGEGQGATFTVTLPLIAVPSKSKQGTAAAQFSLDLSHICALAIDDDSDSLELLTFILEEHGARVVAAASAELALAAMSQFKPDILVSDIGMPGMDGYMLIRQVRSRAAEQGGDIPAIALSAYAGEYDQEQARLAGFQLHLPKPVEPMELVAAIVNLCPCLEGKALSKP